MGDKVIGMVSQGIIVIGRLHEKESHQVLLEPRVLTLFEVPKTKMIGQKPDGSPVLKYEYDKAGYQIMEEKINLKPLPGIPPFCSIPKESIFFDITTDEMNVLPLYKKVTTWGKTLV